MCPPVRAISTRLRLAPDRARCRDDTCAAAIRRDHPRRGDGGPRRRRRLDRLHQIVANLRRPAGELPPVDGEFFAEQAETARWLAAGDRTAVGSLHVLKGMYYVFFNAHAQALACFREARKYEPAMRGSFYVPLLEFYEALALLAEPNEDLAPARAALRRLRAWARHAPQNYAHRAALVAAELARIGGDHLTAGESYERAIALAGEHGLVHEEALACERAAGFYRDRGRQTRLAEAHLRLRGPAPGRDRRPPRAP